MLAKPEVREAFKWLVDYDAIGKTMIKNIGVVHQNFLPIGLLGASKDKPYKLDVAKAKALLAKAGVPNGFKVTIDMRTVQPILEDLAKELEEAAATLGTTRLQTIFKVVIPALMPALLTGMALAFARGVGEYGSIIFIAGNIPAVSEIAPLFTEHCEVKLSGERGDKRQQHWQQIAISACEQSGRVRVPQVLAPQSLAGWLKTASGLRLVLDHEESGRLEGPRPEQGVSLLIGPEGGLSTTEIAQAKAHGFAGIALGNRVLRTETAPVAALSVLQFLWG